MEASWQQNRRKIDANFERQFFENTLFFRRKNNDLRVREVAKSVENQLKTNQKLKAKMECLLASILNGFCCVLESKLGGEIEEGVRKNRARIDQIDSNKHKK